MELAAQARFIQQPHPSTLPADQSRAGEGIVSPVEGGTADSQPTGQPRGGALRFGPAAGSPGQQILGQLLSGIPGGKRIHLSGQETDASGQIDHIVALRVVA